MEWLIGGPAGWQEWAAAAIVAAAAVSLYRHLHGMFGASKPGGSVACRGCAGDCDVPDPVPEQMASIAPLDTTASPAAAPVTPTSNGTPR